MFVNNQKIELVKRDFSTIEGNISSIFETTKVCRGSDLKGVNPFDFIWKLFKNGEHSCLEHSHFVINVFNKMYEKNTVFYDFRDRIWEPEECIVDDVRNKVFSGSLRDFVDFYRFIVKKYGYLLFKEDIYGVMKYRIALINILRDFIFRAIFNNMDKNEYPLEGNDRKYGWDYNILNFERELNKQNECFSDYKRYQFRIITSIPIEKILLRHRMNSFMIRSYRSIKVNKENYKWNLTRKEDEIISQITEYDFERLHENDVELYELLLSKGLKRETARKFLRIALETDIYVTARKKDWDNFISIRETKKNQEEMNEISNKIREMIYDV